jgi:hypothetical protein
MTTSSLYPTHTIICKVPQSSSEFQRQIQPKTRDIFQRFAKKGTDCYKTFGAVINYTLDGVSIHPVTTKTKVSFINQLPERNDNTNINDGVKRRKHVQNKMHPASNKALK